MKDLLIDVGSTFIKYGIYDSVNDIDITEDKVPFPEPCINDGMRFEIEWEKIIAVLRDIFDTGENNGCRAVFISVQMHGYITQNADMKFSNYISWRDKSKDTKRAELQTVDFSPCGTSLKSNLPAAKIDNHDKINAFYTLGSFIAYKFCGMNVTHITDACASGFFFAHDGSPNRLVKNMNVPKVHTTVTPIGHYKSMEFYTPFGDHQVSFLGSCAGDDAYLVNIGTATQISCIDEGTKQYSSEFVTVEKRPFFKQNKRLFTVSDLIGGNELIKGNKTYQLIGQISSALQYLPKKEALFLGGGGAETVKEAFNDYFTKSGYSVQYLSKNIGREGLKMIARSQRTKRGIMLSEVPFVNFPIIAKNSGLDFFIIDTEHGSFDMFILEGLIVNACLVGLDVIIRLGDNTRMTITRFADLGATGFLLPMTNNANDIEQVVKYAKYAPIGKRGISTTRAHTLYNPPPLDVYTKQANERMKIYAQIETKDGISNIDDILCVVGLEGIFIGPNDLSLDLGCVGQNEMLCNAITPVINACKDHTRTWGIITGEKELLAFANKNNVDMVSIGSELNMLIEGCKKVKEMEL